MPRTSLPGAVDSRKTRRARGSITSDSEDEQGVVTVTDLDDDNDDNGSPLNLSVFDDDSGDVLTPPSQNSFPAASALKSSSSSSSSRQPRAYSQTPTATTGSAEKRVRFSQSASTPRDATETSTRDSHYESVLSELPTSSLFSTPRGGPATSTTTSPSIVTQQSTPLSAAAAEPQSLPRSRRSHPRPPTRSGTAPTPRRVLVSPRPPGTQLTSPSSNLDDETPYDTPMSIGSRGVGGGGGRGVGGGGGRDASARNETYSSRRSLIDAAQVLYDSLQPAVETAAEPASPQTPLTETSPQRSTPATLPDHRQDAQTQPSSTQSASGVPPRLASRRLSKPTMF